MRTLLLATAAAAVLATTAQAAPPRAAFDGSEIRRSASFGHFRRSEVLRLAADGSFTGIYHTTRPTARGGIVRIDGAMRGRWSLRGDAICFQGSGLEYGSQSCYRLTKAKFAKEQWSGTNTKTGDVWQFFIYPQSGHGAPRRAAR